MPSPQPVLGMRSKTAAARALQAGGMRPGEIARMMGYTTARRITALLKPKKRRPARSIKSVKFPSDTLAMIETDAAKRNMSVQALAIALVLCAAEEGLVDAILDDEGGAGG